ncbi:MAG: glycosyltransferase [Anaerolineae bacterium]|nr:glycosyltransferase [Anaerolineae bacterium]
MAAILVLTPQLPYPPRQGTALRNWGILQGLAAHHEVSLLSFASPDQALTPDPALAAATARIGVVPQPARSATARLRDLVFTGRPDLIQRLASPDFERQFRSWVESYDFDWLVVEGLEMAPYLAALPGWRGAAYMPGAGGQRPLGVVLDDHNCEYLLQQRAARSDYGRGAGLNPARWLRALYSSIQWRRLRAYEAQVCRDVDLVVSVSKADAAALRAIVPEITPLVIPNGIDVGAYAGFEEAADLAQPAFVFTGTMDFRPNVDGVLWFVQEVWPRVRQTLPDAHFYVVGRHPHPRLAPLGEMPGVVVTGGVPDTRPYIRAAQVYVVPLLVGGGTRLKILESTAMGKPIVATQLAAEGFDNPDRAMILADVPEDFAKACVTLVQNEAARALWGARARTYADAYDWDVLLPRLLDRLGP